MTIVIPGDDPPEIQGSPHLERLKPFGEVVLYKDRPETDEEKLRRATNADILLNSRGLVKWPGHLLRKLPKLKLISVCGIGTDAVDLDAARQCGIVVCNIGGCTAPIVAEHALALMLGVARRAWFQTKELKQGRWRSSFPCVYLRGKTLGIIGAGPIAVETARLGRAIGMEVIAWTFNPSAERAAAMGATFVALEELLHRSDVVSVHVKLTDKSRGLIGQREISLMKPGAILVNTARGPVIDMAAMVAALQSGHLGGAGLDVFDPEPLPPDHSLLKCEQVVLTPHNADATPEGRNFLHGVTVDNIIAFCEGRTQNRVI